MIRRATAADAEAVHALEQEIGGSWTLDSVRSQLRLPSTLAWVAPGAHLLSALVVDEAEVVLLAVSPSQRRQGRARAVLVAAEAAWRQRGATSAWLEVRASNLPALVLYTSHGWEPVGRRPRYYGDGEDAVLMRKVLA